MNEDLKFLNTTIYPNFDLNIINEIKTIDHIIEDENGVIGILGDGTKIRLDGYIGTITMRIRYYLESISSDDINEEKINKLNQLKNILSFEEEEIILARKRLDWAEKIVFENSEK